MVLLLISLEETPLEYTMLTLGRTFDRKINCCLFSKKYNMIELCYSSTTNGESMAVELSKKFAM